MEYREFKLLDTINAYYDFVSVEDAKYLGYIPKEFHSIVNSKCLCGSDRITNKSGSSVMCCNPRCYIKLGYSLCSMLKSFGGRELGEETCKKIMQVGIREGIFKIPSPVEILYNFNEFEYLLGARYDYLVEAVALIQSASLNFYQIVQSVSIPGFDTKCSDYFGDISNSDELLKEFQTYGLVNSMANRRVFDLKKCLNLALRMKDVVLFESLFIGEVERPALKSVKICITGPVSPHGVSMTRDTFIRHCNEISKFDGVRLFDVSEGGPSRSSYVIADSPSGTSKYQTGKYRQDCNPDIKILYTSTEFVDLIKREVEKCETMKELQRKRMDTPVS